MKASLALNGTADYLTLPITPSTTAFSIGFYIRRDSFTTGARIVDWQDGGPANGFRIELQGTSNNSVYQVQISTTGTLVPPATPTGKWDHLVLVYQVNDARLYLNGVLVASDNTVTMTAATQTLTICRRSNASGNFYKGGISQLVVYNGTALTTADVVNLYSNGVIPSGATGIYKLQEGAGTTALDSSGNANNGTITGATFSADTPSTARKQVGGNLVRNGDMEYSPPFTAATTANSRWIDGTAAGGVFSSNIIALHGWGLISGASAQFDSGAMKLSIASGGVGEVSNVAANIASQILALNMQLMPSTSYTVRWRMKTNFTGDSNDGARLILTENTITGSTAVTNSGTAAKGITDWTSYSMTVTTGATTRFGRIRLECRGNTGALTLAGDAWFDDITLTETVPVGRGAVQDFRASLLLAGVQNVATTAHSTDFDLTGDFSMAAWIKKPATPNSARGVFAKSTGATGNYRWSVIPNGIQFTIYGITDINFTSSIVPNDQWAFICITQAAGTYKTYLNGTLQETKTGSQPTGVDVQTIYVGQGRTNELWVGNLSNVRVWKGTALSPTDIASMYTTGIIPSVATLKGEWKLNEGAGLTGNDTSGNARHLTLLSTGATYSADVPSKKRGLINGDQPLNIFPNPVVWLKADSLALADLAPVATWTDSSGAGNNATATGTAQPTYRTNILNGKPVLRFNGTANVMNLPNNFTTQNSVFIAYANATGTGSMISQTGSGSAWLQRNTSIWANANATNFTINPSINTRNLYVQQFDYINNQFRVRVNGTDAGGTNAVIGGVGTFPYAIGARGGNSEFFNGDIAEVIIFARLLTQSEILDVERYLAYKYNVTAAFGARAIA